MAVFVTVRVLVSGPQWQVRKDRQGGSEHPDSGTDEKIFVIYILEI